MPSVKQPKRILCYGDSNTWGQIPLKEFSKSRYPKQTRWTGILHSLGNSLFEVIEEGLNGRTTGPEDPLREGRSGLKYLQPCLDSHVPLDLVIFMLGTNDLKLKFTPKAEDIADRMKVMIKKTKGIFNETKCEAKILLVTPCKPSQEIYEDFRYDSLGQTFNDLVKLYEKISIEEKIFFLDGTNYLVASENDGVHMEPEVHLRFANVIYEKVKSIL